MFVFVGDSLKPSLVAIISVDHDMLKKWAAAEGIKASSKLDLFIFYFHNTHL